MTRHPSRDQGQMAEGRPGNGLGSPPFDDQWSRLQRRVTELYKAKRNEPGRAPEGVVDDGLRAECWAIVREEGL